MNHQNDFSPNNRLDGASILSLLTYEPGLILVEEELASTNTTAQELARKGAPHGSIVIANRQTKGRGRLGRTFASPPDSGLYFSMILRNSSSECAGLLTGAAAVAVCRAVASVGGPELSIKWVNDLFHDGKKCCGILCEAGLDPLTGGVDYVVAGVGLNLFPPEGGFPSEAREVAGTVWNSREAVSRNRLAAAIANQIHRAASALPSRDFVAEYRRRSCTLGRNITVTEQGSVYPARAAAITDDCHLVVDTADGRRELAFGEISTKIINN